MDNYHMTPVFVSKILVFHLCLVAVFINCYFCCLSAAFILTAGTDANQDLVDRIFENVDFPTAGSLPMLNRKVFRGDRVTIQEHPYIVSVRRLYSHYVTGALLNKNVVVTVAHPLYEVIPTELGVVVGENYADRGTTILMVAFVIIHQDFDYYTLTADLALLRLFEDINFRVTIKPIVLVSSKIKMKGETAFVTGWGRCDTTGKELCLPRSSKYFEEERSDPMLRSVKFLLSDRNTGCARYTMNHLSMGAGMLCLGSAREANPLCPCLAVPGAPLVVNAQLAGLQSWGFGCGYTKDLPLIYTNIEYYTRWLKTNLSILKLITKHNLTEMFKASKMQVMTTWLLDTRVEKTIDKELPPLEFRRLKVDFHLSRLSGEVFDIRDFIYNRKYRKLKSYLYVDMKKALKEAEVINDAASKIPRKGKPFLRQESKWGPRIVVKNGSVDVDESVYSEDVDDETTFLNDDNSTNKD